MKQILQYAVFIEIVLPLQSICFQKQHFHEAETHIFGHLSGLFQRLQDYIRDFFWRQSGKVTKNVSFCFMKMLLLKKILLYYINFPKNAPNPKSGILAIYACGHTVLCSVYSYFPPCLSRDLGTYPSYYLVWHGHNFKLKALCACFS